MSEIEIIEKFYNAFSDLNSDEMASLYHDEVTFVDPAFGELKGDRAKNMWRMLCQTQTKETFKVIYSDVKKEGDVYKITWEAFYNFSQTGRKVHNIINANIEFKDGLIYNHTDDFNLSTWAKQALGFKGYIFGKTKFFQNKLNQQTNSLLRKFEAKAK